MEIRYFDAIVVGTGAAGYNAANRILQDGRKSVALLTEGVLCGISGGAALAAAVALSRRTGYERTVLLLPDTGVRYLSTLYK